MICKECGNLLKEGDKFCPNCGSKVELAVPTPGASTSKLDDLVFNLDRKTENRRAEQAGEAEPGPKRDFKFDEINWNLEGYPSEDKKKTEAIDFNWEAVVENGENRRAGGAQDSGNTEYARKETANPQEAAETFAGGPAETDFDTKPPSSTADVQVSNAADVSASTEGNRSIEGSPSMGESPSIGESRTEIPQPEVPAPDSQTASIYDKESEPMSKIDKFYTPNKKNEEFQAILDREYNRLTEKNTSEDTKPQAEGDGSYLGKVNEEVLDKSREDRDAFRAMEGDEPGFEECVADKLETPEEASKVPDILEGQNYSVVGEPSEVTDGSAGASASGNPEEDVEKYIENLNAGDVSLVSLLKSAARKEEQVAEAAEVAKAAESDKLPRESYLGKVDEEFVNPGKDDRNAFRNMEKDAPGFEECVADKLETPNEGPQIPDFMAGQNYSVVGEPEDVQERATETPEEKQETPSTLDDVMGNAGDQAPEAQHAPVEEPTEVVGFAQPRSDTQAPVFVSSPESERPQPENTLDFNATPVQEAPAENNPFAGFEKPAEPVPEPEVKNENAQIIENLINEDVGSSQMGPADNKITFQDVFKDEIKAENEQPKEEAKPKKHTFLKILVIILAVLIVLELIIIVIKSAFPNSAAAAAFQSVFNAVIGKFT